LDICGLYFIGDSLVTWWDFHTGITIAWWIQQVVSATRFWNKRRRRTINISTNLLLDRVSPKKLLRKAKETLHEMLATSGAGFVIRGGIETATMGKHTLNAILLWS
jgi:hypothetical protein